MAEREPESKQWIPDVAFELIGFGIPDLVRFIDQHCKVTLGEWLVLWCIRREGKDSQYGRLILVRDLVRILLTQRFKRANISRLLKSLSKTHPRGQLIKRISLEPEVRTHLFGAGSNRMAAVITPAGERRVDDFKTKLREAFEQWRAEQPRAVRGALLLFRKAAMRFVRTIKQ